MNWLGAPKEVVRPSGRAISIIVGFGLIQAACLFLAAFATRGLFTALHDGAQIPFGLIAILCLAASITAACQALARTRAEAIGHSFAINLREAVFSAIARLPFDVRQRRSMGGLSLRFVGDMSAARGWIGLGVYRLIVGVLVAPSAVVCLWWLDANLAIAGALPLLIALAMMICLGAVLRRRHRRLRKSRAKLAIFAMERIAISEPLMRLGRIPRELRALKKEGRHVADRAVRRVGRVSLLRALPEAGLGIGGAAILWTAFVYDIAPGTAAAALAVLAIAASPIKEMIGVWDRYAAWSVARGRCEALFRAAEETAHKVVAERPISITLKKSDGTCFTCAAGRITGLVIPDVDDAIAAMQAVENNAPVGDWTAIYGDEEAVSARVLRVGDAPALLKGSLRRNLALACDRRPPDAQIEERAREVGLGGLIDRLGGLDGSVGEQGFNLTPTEKLKVSVVQALLADPTCVVIQSFIWPHLPENDKLLAALGHTGATIVHTLPAIHAPGTDVWFSVSDTMGGSDKSLRVFEGGEQICA